MVSSHMHSLMLALTGCHSPRPLSIHDRIKYLSASCSHADAITPLPPSNAICASKTGTPGVFESQMKTAFCLASLNSLQQSCRVVERVGAAREGLGEGVVRGLGREGEG